MTTSPTILTIGHSNREWTAFAALLQAHGAEVVVDVRSMPASRRYPWFSRTRLETALGEIGIGYRFFGDRLGGRPKDPGCWTEGAVDYAKVAAKPWFREGLADVAGLARTTRCCLLCSEKDPMDCHRALLVSRHLAPMGFAIEHVHDRATVESHAAFEDRLLGDGGAPLLLGDDRRALLDAAYERRGKKMSFRK